MTACHSDRPGMWPSKMDEHTVASAAKDFGQLLLSSKGQPYWVEFRPEEQGRNLICTYEQNTTKVLTPEGYSVRSRVHEYGGQAWCFANDTLIFVNAADQQLYQQSLDPSAAPRQITCNDDSRYIEPVFLERERAIVAIEELHLDQRVVNRLVKISIDTGALEVLHQLYDFYAYPTLNPDQTELAFISWNHPYQPWLSTALLALDMNTRQWRIVKGTDSEPSGLEAHPQAISQPLYDEDGILHYVSDCAGWWQIYRRVEGGDQCLSNKKADHITAPWQNGLRHYVIANNKTVSIAYCHEASELRVDDQQIELEGISYLRSVAYDAKLNLIYAIVAGPAMSLSVAQIQHDGQYRLLTSQVLALAEQDISIPQPQTFGHEQPCYGYFYPPKNSAFSAGLNKPPLVVFLHGGPTAATYPIFNPKLQYWTQRGFAVLDLNYRGSSNYGRDYRLALQYLWGESETEDIQCAIKSLIAQGLVDSRALFIRGNSSGGYSALNALFRTNLFAAGASLYGVTDPLRLGEVTHKFESHYLDWLIGDPVADKSRYEAYSPVSHVSTARSPVIFFQGEQDKVVVPEQTRLLVQLLEERGVTVEAHYFQNEGHGFRAAEVQVEVLREECLFYQRYLP